MRFSKAVREGVVDLTATLQTEVVWGQAVTVSEFGEIATT